MQTEAETILKMSETLEGADFTSDQSKAFIESVALSMKTFAVTPELLDDRLAKQRSEWKRDLEFSNREMIGRLDEHRVYTDRRFDEQQKHNDQRFDELDRRFEEDKKHTDRRFDELERRFEEHKEHTDRRFDNIQELQQSLLRHMLGLTLVMVAGLMGGLVAFLTS